MSKLTEHKEDLCDVESLVRIMDMELDLLRNIVFRYYKKYGKEISDDLVEVPEYISFNLTAENGKVNCEICDHKEIGLMSDYQRILAIMKKLKL